MKIKIIKDKNNLIKIYKKDINGNLVNLSGLIPQGSIYHRLNKIHTINISNSTLFQGYIQILIPDSLDIPLNHSTLVITFSVGGNLAELMSFDLDMVTEPYAFTQADEIEDGYVVQEQLDSGTPGSVSSSVTLLTEAQVIQLIQTNSSQIDVTPATDGIKQVGNNLEVDIESLPPA